MIRNSPAQRAFAIFNYSFLTLVSLSMLIPFMHIFAGSFSSGKAITQGLVSLWPVEWTFGNYQAVLGDRAIWRALGFTVMITVLGTTISLFLTSLGAYGLSKRDLKGRSLVIVLILFTMIFQAPLIPTYLLVKSLGMLNTIWALVIPNAIAAFNLIIMISFFQNIPDELLDSAKMDGCGEYGTLWRIVLPLSMPSISTIGLFYAVSLWNGYFWALMFIRDPKKYPLMVLLRRLLVESDDKTLIRANMATMSVEGIKMASIIVATLPILIVYPMIQKHFVKGAMLGSIKG
ncbi:carbohydrate ABC transporter permease [Paenibacillus koleovorans]|uniref:carbohydrate ABC transporter permease n=1 Tax=Paenibacillus koleovorans TaxID=121608 RepID=UPI001FEAFD70|nr:carbohydrate ABC transporter permease [Paenibacillus koleovorans]